MKTLLRYSSFIGTLLLVCSSGINLKSVEAREIVFDQKSCIQNFVSQGLTTAQAKVWCKHKKDCLEESDQQGLPPDVAESVCNCSINEFKKRYTIQQFENLTRQAENNPSIKQKLTDVGEACFENILFEE